MNINQLNGTGVTPLLPTAISANQKIFTPDISLPISIAQSTVSDKPESEEQIRQAVQKILLIKVKQNNINNFPGYPKLDLPQ